MRWACLLLLLPSFSSSLDLGRGGVYDSPAAQDYWVRRFGFLFGGGRSGMGGLKALQESVNTRARTHRVALVQPQQPKVVQLLRKSMKEQGSPMGQRFHLPSSPKYVSLTKESEMVEMAPMMIHNRLDRSGRTFHRFMAVPHGP